MQTKISKKLKGESHASSKKRTIVQRIVVAVKVETHDKKQKSEGPPSDSWSWRKYGQKPIKGSPYPRGYYRCSTSKGCTAKKQVERCKTDASMLIVTYTSTHNHPGPDLPITNTNEESKEPLPPATGEHPKTPNQEEEPKKEQRTLMKNDEAHLHYSQSPFNDSQDIITNQDENSLKEKLDTTYESPRVVFEEEPHSCPQVMNFPTCKSDENESPRVVFEEEPHSCPQVMNFPTCKSDENDFYDELDELPSTSSFTELLRSSFIEGRILVKPF